MVQELIETEMIYKVTTPTEFCRQGRFTVKDIDKARLIVHYRSIKVNLERQAFIMTPYKDKFSIKKN